MAEAKIAVTDNTAGGAGYLNRALARQGLEGLVPEAVADFRQAAELDPRYKARFEEISAKLAKPAAPAPEAAKLPPPHYRFSGKVRWGAGSAAGLGFILLLAMDYRRRRSRRVRFASVI